MQRLAGVLAAIVRILFTFVEVKRNPHIRFGMLVGG
jgi:hypothetical protein